MKPQALDKPYRQRGAITAIAFSMLLGSLGTSIVAIALPALADTFNRPISTIQWVVLTYLLAITVTSVPIGRVSDYLGLKRVLVTGLVVFTLASIIGALAPNLATLLVARALQGVAAAALLSLPLSAVRQYVATEKIGTAMGLLGTTSAIGTALGPSLGGLLIDLFGWNAVFLLMALLGGVTSCLCFVFLPADEPHIDQNSPRLDIAGLVVLMAALSAYALAMSLGQGMSAGMLLGLLGGAAVGFIAFLQLEKRVRQPLIDFDLLRQPPLALGAAMMMLVSTVMMSVLIVGPFFLVFGLGHPGTIAGLVMTVGPVVAALSGLPAGWLTDKLGAETVLIAGLAQMILGALAFAWLSVVFGTVGFMAALVLLTPGYQLFLAAANTSVIGRSPAHQRGVVSGIMTLARNLGFLTGASLMGTIFAVAVGTNTLQDAAPSSVATGMVVTFMISGFLIAIAMALGWLLRPGLEKHDAVMGAPSHSPQNPL